VKKDPEDPHRYEDMLELPHHVSASHAHMTAHDRAAQFSPFAALTGYEAAIDETARRTGEKEEPDEDRKLVLDRKLRILREKIGEHPVISVTYFQPDEQKEGGFYITVSGNVKKVDENKRSIVMMSGESIPAGDIAEMRGEIFKSAEEMPD